MSSNSRRVRSIERAADEGLERSARISSSPAVTGPARAARLGAAAAAHDGLDARDELLGVARLGEPVVGAEAQAAHALGDRRVAGADDDAEAGQRRRRAARGSPSACGPRTARSTTTASRRMATSVSTGTGLASTRCSQPRRSRRLPSTCRKPESVSMTASRSGAASAADGRSVMAGPV